MAGTDQVVAGDREGRPSPIDVHVGTRIRLRRTLLGMSQERLGEALGLTFQQVQKYERGVNRVGASRLFDLSRVLDVPISFFFDDMPDSLTTSFGMTSNRKTMNAKLSVLRKASYHVGPERQKSCILKDALPRTVALLEPNYTNVANPHQATPLVVM